MTQTRASARFPDVLSRHAPEHAFGNRQGRVAKAAPHTLIVPGGQS
jgi:hypothetical protein